MNKILIIVAHGDDEVLGMGGTIQKHTKNKDVVNCLILGDGVSSRNNKQEQFEKEKRNEESLKAAKILGIKKVSFCEFKDNQFDSIPLLKITKKIEKELIKFKPDIIYTHHQGDLNIDHQKTFEAVMTACRPCNNNSPKKIYSFEVLSSTEWQVKDNNKIFKPNTYINIEKEIKTKIKAMKAYKSELRKYPHSRSIEGIEILAKFRGLESGIKFAEAVELIREIKQ